MKLHLPEIFFTFLCSCILSISFGQTFDDKTFADRDSLINILVKQAAYEPLKKAIQEQIAYLEATGRHDSIYKYMYNAATAVAKTQGSEACLVYAKDLSEKIFATDPNITHHLITLNDLSWVYIETGYDSLCFEVDQRYLDVCLNYVQVKPMELSTAYYSLGFDYQMIGNAKQAISHFEKALEPILHDTLAYMKRLIDCYNALGAAHYRNGDYSKARKNLNRGLKLTALITDTLELYMNQANFYGNLSLAAQDEGNLVECKEYLHKGIEIRKRAMEMVGSGYALEQQERLLIYNYHNLAALYLALGDMSRAEKLTRYTRDLRKRYLVPEHPDHKKASEAFGSIQYALGENDAALENFRNYLQFCIRDYGRYSYYTAIANQRMAKVLFELKDYNGSVVHFSETIAISKVISDKSSGQELAQAYMMRSEPLMKMERYEEAAADLMAAETIYRNTRKPNDPIFGRLYNTIAELKSLQNQADSAEIYTDKAMALLLDKQALQVAKSSSKFSGLINYLPETYYNKAMLVKNRLPGNEGLVESMNLLQESVNYLKTTGQIYEDEASQLNFLDQHKKTFDGIQEICYALYSGTGQDSYIEKMHQLAEENRSVILRRQLNHFSSLRVSAVPDSVIAKERLLMRELSGQLGSEEGGRDIFEVEREYETLIKHIQKMYPEYFNLRYQETVARLEQIQMELLSENQNIIHYILTESNAYALLIHKNLTRLVRLDFDVIKTHLDWYNESIVNRNDGRVMKSSLVLYEKLFKPLEPFIIGDEIFVIPDEALFSVNFETLTRPSSSGKPDYLIYHYTISYLLSATTALQYNGLNRESSKGVLAFAPGFFDDLKQLYRNEVKDSTGLDEEYFQRIQQPFAVQTATEVASMFSGKAFITEEATEFNFKEQASRYGIIHLGTHTEINNVSPLLSRLVLTKPPPMENVEDDGYLHAYEIYNMSLRAELAVLTACETGTGKQSNSEGTMSLAHSFAYAGCPSVVLSLWEIDEKTSAEIIHSFYENLAEGMPKNKALRQAKLDFLEKNPGELGIPYYWAGMILMGDASPVQISASQLSWWVIAGIILIAIAIYFAYRLINRKSEV